MDINFFLRQRTAFIRYFYETAVRPFDEIKNAIENEEDPYISTYSEESEPQFMEEWAAAEHGVDAVCHACLSMLSSSLHLFLREWVDRLEKTRRMKFNVNFKKGWFNGYKQIFMQLKLPLSECAVDLDVVEQVTLARNRVQHPENLTALGIDHAESDLGRFPNPFFASENELIMAKRDKDDSVRWWLRPSIKSSGEKILLAIEQVEMLCSWLDEEYWKIVPNCRPR
jgi:hypothetical protein